MAESKSQYQCNKAELNSSGVTGFPVIPLSAHLAGITFGPAALGRPNGTCVMGATPGLFPISNGSNSLFTALTSANKIYSGVGKMDYHVNNKNSLGGMFFVSPGDATSVDNHVHEIDPRWITAYTARARVGTAGWTYSPNFVLVNSFRFGYSRYYQANLSTDHTVNPIDYGICTGVTNPASFGFLGQICPGCARVILRRSASPQIGFP